MDIDIEVLNEIITNWYKNERQIDCFEAWEDSEVKYNEKENTIDVIGTFKFKNGKRWGDTVTLTYEKDLSEDANENDYIVNLYHAKGTIVETKKTLKGRLEEGKLTITEIKKEGAQESY